MNSGDGTDMWSSMRIANPMLRFARGSEPGSSAMFSQDEKYRYQLERLVVEDADTRRQREICGRARPVQRRLVACGLNPSTADAFKLDPTCRREMGFARAWRCTIYTKVNAYAWRDTKPVNMWAAEQRGEEVVAGPRLPGVSSGHVNDLIVRMSLTQLKRDGGIALACWGVHARPDRVQALTRIAAEVGVEWQCLGVNKDGSPRHPLYVAAATELQPWPSPEF